MDTALSVQSGRWVLAAITVLVGAAAVLLLAAGLPVHGLVLGGAVLFPYLLYVAFTRPLAFPFGLYVLLVPFDNILSFGSFGTITKLLGIVSGAFSCCGSCAGEAMQRPRRRSCCRSRC